MLITNLQQYGLWWFKPTGSSRNGLQTNPSHPKNGVKMYKKSLSLVVMVNPLRYCSQIDSVQENPPKARKTTSERLTAAPEMGNHARNNGSRVVQLPGFPMSFPSHGAVSQAYESKTIAVDGVALQAPESVAGRSNALPAQRETNRNQHNY